MTKTSLVPLFVFLLPAIACGCAKTEVVIKLQPALPGALAWGVPKHPSIPMGRLGFPLGTYVTIEGHRIDGKKTGTRTLLVDAMDGVKLDNPIRIGISNVRAPGLPKEVRCIVRGYESGEMIGVPLAVAKAENLPFPQKGWGFHRYFIVTSVVEP
ncbi:unnamed protein product, partial [marine sediment metagenome]